ncbi:MAG: fasciclin domain-containing protein [Planctomycetes bacterium]|nr:fasciclin domain-containing protein [Planctomycetota bacterium]
MLTISLLALCSILPQEQCPAAAQKAVLTKLPTTTIHAEKDIVTTAVEAGSFPTLVAALKAADLVGALQAKGPFTVFAPTEEAFAKLPKGTVENLLKPENKAQLQAILKYHVVAGKVDAAAAMKASFAPTLQGQRATITTKDGKVMIDGATVVKADIACSNGIIHVIDNVILPTTKDIVDVAVGAGSFQTLATALQASGLVEALKGDGPFTVFAPTDAAFAKLPKGTVENLLKPENKAQLQAILKYHVVSGLIYSDAALAAGKAQTLQGSNVTIAVKNGSALVNDAKLIKLDVQAKNGVIHVIDTVILPPAAGDKH